MYRSDFELPVKVWKEEVNPMSMRKRIAVIVSCALMMSLGGSSLADIVGTTGAIVDSSLSPPASVVPGATESDTDILLFPEATQTMLGAPVAVDISVPGFYSFPGSAPFSPGVIPAGATVDSYFLHFDRVSATGFARLSGSATFDCPIVGVIVLTANLDASDASLGRAGTTYPTGAAPARGLEFEENVTLSADRLTLSVELEIQAGTAGDNTVDQIRIITQCPPEGVCPKTQGFWKNHPDDWPVTSLMLGSQTYTQMELLAIFRTPPRGDASLILAHQLIAAKLNIANGSDPAPIAATILHADGLLSTFSGKLPYGVAPSSTAGKAMVADAKILDKYNNGLFTPDCGDR
jgi:hypothetical protein